MATLKIFLFITCFEKLVDSLSGGDGAEDPGQNTGETRGGVVRSGDRRGYPAVCS